MRGSRGGHSSSVPAPAQRFAQRSGPLRLLVVGGSLGALALNTLIPQALALLKGSAADFVIQHQSGAKHLALLQANYATAGVDADCVAFISDMAAAYAWADVVICRAGALTVAEVAAAGCAALFVPFPFAVDDHQTANADFLLQHDAAWLMQQSELTASGLAQWLSNLQRTELAQRAGKARALARPDATERVVAICKELAQ